jgi:hypothetical protein
LYGQRLTGCHAIAGQRHSQPQTRTVAAICRFDRRFECGQLPSRPLADRSLFDGRRLPLLRRLSVRRNRVEHAPGDLLVVFALCGLLWHPHSIRPPVGLARVVGYHGGMDENPYQSPPTATERGRPFIPAWRRAVSLYLIVFGAIFSLALPLAVIDASVHGEFRMNSANVISILLSVAGVSAVWFGVRLRRPR